MQSYLGARRRTLVALPAVLALAVLAAVLPGTAATAYQATHRAAAVPPQPPVNVQIIGEDGGLHLIWDSPPGEPTVKVYRLGFTPAIRGLSFWDLELGVPHTNVRVGGIPIGQDYTFSVQSVTDDGTSAPVTRSLLGSRISIAIPASVPLDSKVDINGYVTSADAGAPLASRAVLLYRNLDGPQGRRYVGSTMTSSTGFYAFHPRATRGAKFYVRFPSESAVYLGALTARHTVAVRQKVTLKVSDTSVHRGTTVFFTGRVTPTDAGKVKLERWHANTGHWTVVDRDVLRSSGHYVLDWAPRHAKDVQLRVVTKKIRYVPHGVSPVRVVQVT
jgi:hypothetical protein